MAGALASSSASTSVLVALTLVLLASIALAAPIVQPAGPIELSSMEILETGQGTELRVEADGPLIWTQYRDEQGDLVVELPNTRVAPTLGTRLAGQGLLQGVEVLSEDNGDRPLTRLLIRTRDAAEHSLFVDDRLLTLQFVAVGSAQPTAVAAETQPPAEQAEPTVPTVPTEEAPSAAPEQTEVAVQPRGTSAGRGEETSAAPVSAPATTGLAATRLIGVQAVEGPDGIGERILGDGEFNYSTFALESPSRFVIDLEGVVNTAPRPSVAVDGAAVTQVRVAQFEPYPNPVTRVVLDLTQDTAPVIQRGPDGLTLSFPSAGASPSDDLVAQLEPADAVEPEAEAAVLVAETDAAPPLQDPDDEAGFDDSEFDDSETELAQVEGQEAPALEPLDDSAPIEIVLSPDADDTGMEDEGVAAEETFDVAADSQEPPEALQEPLFIEDTTRRERPNLLPGGEDVTLYEAQETSPLAQADEQRSGSQSPSFGVQTVDNTRRWVGEPVTMSLKDASITEVLRTIARVSDLNLVIQPGVEGTVTVELVAVPWDQALDQILKVNGLGMQLDGNILRVAQTETLQAEAVAEQTLKQARALSVPLTTVLKRLSYARATDVSRILTQAQRSGGRGGGGALGRLGIITPGGILSQRGTVSVDARTNTLIIQELPDYLDTVIQVIENLDTPERQVMIEARVVEATRNFTRSLGVQWGLQGEASARYGNTTGLDFPNNIAADGGVQLLRGGNNGSLNLSLGNVLNSFQLDVALRAAETEGLINIISAPKVATLNNERASVQSGLQIPIQTVANNTVSVQFINATLRLSVQPQVTAEGTIIMDIDIQKREPLLAFAVVGATNAPISTRDAQTRVIVRDGGTAVIGGIYTISSNEGSDRVPGLANVPILGHLFKNRAKDTTNEELLIFITPRVIQL